MVLTPEQCALIDFEGKDPKETFHFYTRQHWIRLLKSFFWMLIITIATCVTFSTLFSFLPIEDPLVRKSMLLLVMAIFLASQFTFLLKFYHYFLYVIIVTDKRIHRIKKTLLTIDNHETIDLWLVQDIDKSQMGIIQNLLGFGTLCLNVQDTELKLHFIPHISHQYDEILHLREAARTKLTEGERGGVGYMMR